MDLNLNMVDMLIIIVCLLGAWKGYRTGLLRNLIHLVALVAALVCGVLFSRPIAEFLEQQFHLQSSISAQTSAAVAQVITVPAGMPDASAVTNPLSEAIQQLRQLSLPPATIQFLEEQLQNLADITLGDFVGNTAGLIGDMLANMLVNAFVFALIMVVVNIAANLVVWLLRDVLHVVGGGLDSMGGMCLGLLQALLIVSLVLAVAIPFFTWQSNSHYAMLLQNSFLANGIIEGFYRILGQGMEYLGQQVQALM